MIARLIRWVTVSAVLVTAAVIGAVAFAHRAFDRRVADARATLLDRAGSTDGPAVTISEAMLADLPAPVRRYLSFTGVVGRPFVRTAHLTQRGGMHPRPDGPWLPLEAEQDYTVDPPGFVWDATVRGGPLPILRGCDSFVDGHGRMDIKAGALLKIVDETGEEMDQASLVRYLSEMIWFPTAFLGPNISFEAIDDHRAQVTLADRGRTASGTMVFDDDGRLVEFLSQRHRLVDGRHELATWSTPVVEYGQLAGLRVPTRGKAVWKLPEGDLEYIDVTITDLRFDD